MSKTLDISKLNFPELMDLRTAAIYLELSGMRVRTLAREGDIGATKDEAGHWEFAKGDLDAYKAKPRTRKSGQRGDGNLWQIRIKFKDLEGVKKALAPFGIELQPRYNYEKQKEYRAKQKAKKAAAKAAAKHG